MVDLTSDFAIWRRSVKLVRRQSFAALNVTLHFFPAACWQTMTRLKQIHRCTHDGIDRGRSEASYFGVRKQVRGRGRMDSRWRTFQSGDASPHSKALLRRMRQIARCELKSFLQLSVKIFEGRGELPVDAFASCELVLVQAA